MSYLTISEQIRTRHSKQKRSRRIKRNILGLTVTAGIAMGIVAGSILGYITFVM